MLLSVFENGWRICIVKVGTKWVHFMPIGGRPKVQRVHKNAWRNYVTKETGADPRKVVEMLRRKPLKGQAAALLNELETNVNQGVQ